jgi:hypothetical protein
MDAKIRRFVMLCIIVTFGLILVFFDFTLIQLLGLMLLIVIVMPFLLGIITINEVRTGLKGLGKTGILKRLKEMKFFEKPASVRKVSPKVEKPVQKPVVQAPKPKVKETTGGIRFHISSFFSSLSSLGTIVREKTKEGKKVEDINKMLDSAVSEKVPKTVPPAIAERPSAPSSPGAGPAAETDPFLALSNDDFDPGLLDGLDDDVASFPSPDGEPAAGGAGLALPEPELSMDLSEGADASPAVSADSGTPDDGGLDAFKGLDGEEMPDEDFGDLENLNLDDVELDDDMGGSTPAAPAPSVEVPAATVPSPGASPEDSGPVKTAWIPSDAPKGTETAEDQLGVQADMASFASSSGGGSDEDLLSSIASDVKTVKKDKDVSLLRELKDFKAPADEIENELKDMFGRMSTVQKPKEKSQPPANGIK